MNDAASVRRWARWAWQELAEPGSMPPKCPLPTELARAQRLEGLLCAALRAVRDPREKLFTSTAREIVGTNLMRPLALAPVLNALRTGGVKALLYKGGATTGLFPELRGVRAVGDADLLVARRDFARSRSILLELGFEEQIAGEPVSYWSNNERVFVGGKPELQVDLHRGLHRRPLFDRLSEFALASAEESGGVWLPNLSSVPLLAAAHRAKHGYTADARELMDVAAAFRRFRDRDYADLAERSEELKLPGALYALWSLVRAWFGETSAAETAAFLALGDRIGWRRRAIDELVALDSPTDANKPWAGRGFVKLYATYPFVARGVLAPAALMAAHVALRTADRIVGGAEVLEPASR